MIKIYKKISLEPFINRDYPIIRAGIDTITATDENGNHVETIPLGADEYVNENEKYGKIDRSFIYFPIYFTQTIENIGLFTNEEFIAADDLINSEPDYFTRKTGLNVEYYYTFDEYLVTGSTESQIEVVQLYSQNNPYVAGLNVSDTPSLDFTGVLSVTTDSVIYVIGGQLDNSGNYIPNTGIIYETFLYDKLIQNPLTGEYSEIPYTTFKYYTKGIRDYNTVLMALIHEEKYLNVINEPTIDNDLLFDRGVVNVNERHLRMSEIDTVEQLIRYNQNYFNVKKF
jgi:hypothetical protein